MILLQTILWYIIGFSLGTIIWNTIILLIDLYNLKKYEKWEKQFQTEQRNILLSIKINNKEKTNNGRKSNN